MKWKTRPPKDGVVCGAKSLACLQIVNHSTWANCHVFIRGLTDQVDWGCWCREVRNVAGVFRKGREYVIKLKQIPDSASSPFGASPPVDSSVPAVLGSPKGSRPLLPRRPQAEQWARLRAALPALPVAILSQRTVCPSNAKPKPLFFLFLGKHTFHRINLGLTQL